MLLCWHAFKATWWWQCNCNGLLTLTKWPSCYQITNVPWKSESVLLPEYNLRVKINKWINKPGNLERIYLWFRLAASITQRQRRDATLQPSPHQALWLNGNLKKKKKRSFLSSPKYSVVLLVKCEDDTNDRTLSAFHFWLQFTLMCATVKYCHFYL